MLRNKIIIGSRGSILAMAQTELVVKMLKEKFPEMDFEIKVIVTTGDKDMRTNWGDKNVSLKSFFTKEIEKELLEKDIDLAVHSMKDMPAVSPDGLICGAIPIREDNRDVFVSKSGKKLSELPENPIIGTSSLRRAVMVKDMRPDAEIKPIRGNIHTRLKKLEEENFDGIVLAAAGLIRVGLQDRITQFFTKDEIMPAPAQGALCVQCREDDKEILEILEKIVDKNTTEVVAVEREFSKIFDGGCHTPMGCAAEIIGDEIEIKGIYYSGEKLYRGTHRGKREKGIILADELAEKIRGNINE